ncbi:anion permease [Lentilactobacillus curieae]|uniref:Probable membrane transporter protein n=1 Tax=Lentilactobacillus curieae TaxID=1138822 RepID=A0A1S6QHE4_9LACO|nr:sulfite exporter TauE/SafE family protein [Lentilactobacillus curieae]AQW21022.1 anion permease [Lentilactobacillus curieae]
MFQAIIVLFPAGILAGIMSSTTGMASLVSYPALLAVGVPPVFANVTNTTALVLAGAGATVSSQKELKHHYGDLMKVMPLTLLGSILGAILLLEQPADTFEKVVPFFVLAAGLILAFPPSAASLEARQGSKWRSFGFDLLIIVVGAYTGYFGAAGGVMLLALLSRSGKYKFTTYNALKNVSLGASNLLAAIIYAFKSHIYWILVIPLAIGFFVGGFIGPRIVRLIPERLMKGIVVIGAIGLSIWLFLDAYGFVG